jgi:hypothetical protein
MPLTIEVLAPVPTFYTHCDHCEIWFGEAGINQTVRGEQVADYPNELLADYARLCDWMRELVTQYAGRVQVRIVDPQSLVGVAKALRHRIHRYPSFLVGGRRAYVGWEKEKLAAVVASHLRPTEVND